jgi:hypothetical protein
VTIETELTKLGWTGTLSAGMERDGIRATINDRGEVWIEGESDCGVKAAARAVSVEEVEPQTQYVAWCIDKISDLVRRAGLKRAEV